MRILVTAGNTQVPIDRVRCITNIFTGRTGTRIALHAQDLGHDVRLLTSHANVVTELQRNAFQGEGLEVVAFQTFDDLHGSMGSCIRAGGFDAVVHCAAVSDYLPAGVFAASPGTRFDPAARQWNAAGSPPTLQDRNAGKVKSDEAELWLRLVRAPKIIDRVRSDWDFQGVLVKFKLEVGITEARLIELAEKSRLQSAADFMVANTLEGAAEWAILGPVNGRYSRITRDELPSYLLKHIIGLHEERRHG